ncbi:MAG TPA: hypothetical protein VK306_00560 [Acidimicrobiales bacterium]|nr:hypothetical protein [Acidimicrobiales bacterium]
MKIVRETHRATEPISPDTVPTDVRRRIALAHQRAQRLLAEASSLVLEQQQLEGSIVAVGAVAGEDAWDELRNATGLAALDSVLGNVAADISAPGGGLWCGGPPRPWPATAWPVPQPAGAAAGSEAAGG